MSNSKSPERIVSIQVLAYNNRSIEDFLNTYDTSVPICNGVTGDVVTKGYKAVRKRYQETFRTSPELCAKIKKRIVMGPLVIDHEHVTGIGKENRTSECVVIYEVDQGLIKNVWFFDKPDIVSDISPETYINEQIKAYNQRNLKAFMATYTPRRQSL